MSTPTTPLDGDALLEAVTTAMVALHLRHHGREPATARSTMMDDEVVACVMGGVYTSVEQTLIELEHDSEVQQARRAFHAATSRRFTSEVQRLSGRNVTAFTCGQHIGPDLEIMLFVLAPADTDGPRAFPVDDPAKPPTA